LQIAIEHFGRASKWSEVATQISGFVHQHGFSVVEQMVGHGVGREMHEPPQAPNFVNKKTLREDFSLRPGLVIAIEPMVNAGKKDVICLDDKWTQVTADGSLSAHFEHTVALTSDGPIRLTAGPGTEADEWLGSS
jgi:methionyl aminopeptidase